MDHCWKAGVMAFLDHLLEFLDVITVDSALCIEGTGGENSEGIEICIGNGVRHSRYPTCSL
jgi:hypothetical protein